MHNYILHINFLSFKINIGYFYLFTFFVEANQGSESRCRSCGTCLRKEIADTGTQTEESFFQDKSKGIFCYYN